MHFCCEFVGLFAPHALSQNTTKAYNIQRCCGIIYHKLLPPCIMTDSSKACTPESIRRRNITVLDGGDDGGQMLDDGGHPDADDVAAISGIQRAAVPII